VCDGAKLGGETCESQGFGPGTLGCARNCDAFNTSNCGDPIPYGTVSVAFSTDYVRNNTDQPDNPSGILVEAFASGTFGAADRAIPDSSADASRSYAVSYQDVSGNGVQVIQVSTEGQNPINPAVMAFFNEQDLAVGTMSFGLEANDQQMMVVDTSWQTGQIECVHAIGNGVLEVTVLGDVTNHGEFAFEGDLNLFHPSNYLGQDVSGQLGLPACPLQ